MKTDAIGALRTDDGDGPVAGFRRRQRAGGQEEEGKHAAPKGALPARTSMIHLAHFFSSGFGAGNTVTMNGCE